MKNHIFQVILKVLHYAMELLIGFPSPISGILINQNQDIVCAKDKIDVPPSMLNFSYKMFVEKHVSNIILRIIPNFDKSDLAVGNVLYVTPMNRPIRSHILRVPRQKAKTLHEIIATSTTEKGVIEILNQMLNP